jgi:CRP/FNR family transcriptional regulator, anaerobic regulatory protein
MDKASILAKFGFYVGAGPSVQAEMASEARSVTLQPHTYFYHEGDRCSHFALVGSGDIRVFKSGESGHEITLYHVQDGNPCLVNMLCVFLDQPAMANAVVEAPTEAVIVPGAVFRNWIATNEKVRKFVFAVMAQRLVNVMVLVEELAFRRMDERLARLLMQRFSNPERTLRVIAETHEELAGELGTAREVVSRLLKEFERLGAIAIARGRVELSNENILRSLAAGNRGR